MAVVAGSPLGRMVRDGDTAAFLDGTARGVFLLERCCECGQLRGPQEGRCPDCASASSEPVPASGRAALVSWTVVHGRLADGSTGPISLQAIGQLEEGPWWWAQVVDADPAQVAIGRRLAIDFEPAEGGETLPVFRLA